MIRVRPPAPDRNALDGEFRRTPDGKLRDRLPIVLMAGRGRRPADTAADPGVGTRTVPRWLDASLEHGPDGLRPRKAPGAAPEAPDRPAAGVRRRVLGGRPGPGERDVRRGRRPPVRAARDRRRPASGPAGSSAAIPCGPKDAKARTGRSKARRRRAAAPRRHVARPCPPAANPRVVLVIGGAPWHRGKASGAAVADHPRLAFHRRPSYAPSPNPVERSWRGRRRRATHSRPFDPPADLKRPIRNSLCYSQTVPERGRSLVAGCYPAPKATPSPNS